MFHENWLNFTIAACNLELFCLYPLISGIVEVWIKRIVTLLLILYPSMGSISYFIRKSKTLERLFAWLCLVLTLYVVTRDCFRLQGMEIYSLLVIHAYRSLVCDLHMLDYYLSTAFSHVNALQPGVSQSNNVLSWKLFYWFFSCFFVNLMFSCTVTAFLPSNQHCCFLCLSHAFFSISISDFLRKQRFSRSCWF